MSFPARTVSGGFFPFPSLKNHSVAVAMQRFFALGKKKNKPARMTLSGWIPKILGFQNGISIFP